MQDIIDRQDMQQDNRYHRALSISLWIAVFIGWAVSIFAIVEELCLATACRDTASFTFFTINIGWLGIFYFSLILILLWLRRKNRRLDLAVAALIFGGVGAEFRLLWIQKYIIGSWCPLCVTICCSLFIAALLLLIGKAQGVSAVPAGAEKSPLGWMAFVLTMIVAGYAIALMGVQALT